MIVVGNLLALIIPIVSASSPLFVTPMEHGRIQKNTIQQEHHVVVSRNMNVTDNTNTTNASSTSHSTSNEHSTTILDPWLGLGGGAVNEKPRSGTAATAALGGCSMPSNVERSFDPTTNKAQLWHALEGLDRYPNYLSRWSMDDINTLEEALHERLRRVRQQKSMILDRRLGMDDIVQSLLRGPHESSWRDLVRPPRDWNEVRHRILDPRASRAIFDSRGRIRVRTTPSTTTNQTMTSHTPTVEQVLSGEILVDLECSRLVELLDEEFYDVFSFRLLSVDFCRRIRDYVTAVIQSVGDGTMGDSTDPNSIDPLLLIRRRPMDLDWIGLGWLNDLLFHLIVRPISRHLFMTSETVQDLDWRQGYVAGFSAQPSNGKPRDSLVTHTDDSEVTMNICLGDEGFQGGLLEFRGLRGTDRAGQDVVGTFQPEPGLALLHAGRHFHRVTSVTSGDRFVYIMWARSWRGIRSRTCPCCWLNRRSPRDDSCICGPRWN